MITIEELKKDYVKSNSYEQKILLADKILEYTEFNSLKLLYSSQFIKELKLFIDRFKKYKEFNINLISLMVSNDKANDGKAESIHFIKNKILSQFSEKDLNYLRLNHLSLIDFLKRNPEYIEIYSESKFLNGKEFKEKFKDEKTTNFLVLKKEYEVFKKHNDYHDLFGNKYRSMIVKDVAYGKPVYLGLKHLFQKKIFMEGPYIVSKCPKCGEKVIHLLEGAGGNIYCCSNHICKFFISGNFFLKKGSKDLIKYFNIKEEIHKKRNSSHYRIYKTLNDIQNRRKYVEIESDGFVFVYKYYIEENSISLKLIQIRFNNEVLEISDLYKYENIINNFVSLFFEKNL